MGLDHHLQVQARSAESLSDEIYQVVVVIHRGYQAVFRATVIQMHLEDMKCLGIHCPSCAPLSTCRGIVYSLGFFISGPPRPKGDSDQTYLRGG